MLAGANACLLLCLLCLGTTALLRPAWLLQPLVRAEGFVHDAGALLHLCAARAAPSLRIFAYLADRVLFPLPCLLTMALLCAVFSR